MCQLVRSLPCTNHTFPRQGPSSRTIFTTTRCPQYHDDPHRPTNTSPLETTIRCRPISTLKTSRLRQEAKMQRQKHHLLMPAPLQCWLRPPWSPQVRCSHARMQCSTALPRWWKAWLAPWSCLLSFQRMMALQAAACSSRVCRPLCHTRPSWSCSNSTGM